MRRRSGTRRRRRKRAEALLEAQKTWTAKEWARWQKREQAKHLGRGTPAWLLQEVATQIAEEEGLTHDQVTERLIELGCIDFIMQGALNRVRGFVLISHVVAGSIGGLLTNCWKIHLYFSTTYSVAYLFFSTY